MKKFEYQEVLISVNSNLVEELNAYGQEGWEVVYYKLTDYQYQANFHCCLLKREVR